MTLWNWVSESRVQVKWLNLVDSDMRMRNNINIMENCLSMAQWGERESEYSLSLSDSLLTYKDVKLQLKLVSGSTFERDSHKYFNNPDLKVL